MSNPAQEEITDLLLAWGNGDRASLDKLVPLVYQELRRLAHRQMRRERAGDTLQTTALVNEAYSIQIPGREIPKRVAVSLVAVLVIVAVGLALALNRQRAQPSLTVPSRSAESQPTTKINSLAVLPFRPLVSSSRDEALEMGMADTLILKLSGMQEFIVRPINAVRKYAELEQDAVAVGREQKVDAVLDGSIQKSADKVRVTVRLVQVEDGKQLWAESFDEKFTDIFALQDRVSERVVEVLALRLKGQQVSLTKRYTDNPDAYELYLKGRYHLNRLTDDGFFKGRDYFLQATEKDPKLRSGVCGVSGRIQSA
jgi:TolB-like protein